MAIASGRSTVVTPCESCPLRSLTCFRDFTPEELAFVARFKIGETLSDAGLTVLSDGSASPHLYTVLAGWGFRYKILDDGRRQILNYVLPGNLVGLQGTLMGEMQHSVEALTPLRLCVFERARLPQLFQQHAGLAYDLTWIAAREERILDEHLLSIGRRSAVERAAYLLAHLALRVRTLRMAPAEGPFPLPLTQSHVADTLGLSIVHTNKTLRRLVLGGYLRWLDRGCEVLDIGGLARIAGWEPGEEPLRPFI